ncbi:hypothetical protein RRG08_024531 [Elysia crispata]|uniref:Uncharacterized protein n=1 Tax=Elysia crispata TaxID=231223 RepID=A0AAE0Y8K3_9GAST|nr:hypothetical protein RRG08_024531 [Elysia crispata]
MHSQAETINHRIYKGVPMLRKTHQGFGGANGRCQEAVAGEAALEPQSFPQCHGSPGPAQSVELIILS